MRMTTEDIPPLYHGTNDLFDRFSTDKTQDGLFWFTSDRSKIEAGESGAAGCRYIMEVRFDAMKLAGWDEYDRYTIDELIAQGFDGLKLDDDYVAFHSEQVTVIGRAEHQRERTAPRAP